MAGAVADLTKIDPETVRKLEERLKVLEERVKREVEELGLIEKINLIIRDRGSCADWTCCDRAFGDVSRLRVHRNCTGIYYVWYRGRKVFEYHIYDGREYVEVYRPGTWITELINLAEAAKLRLAEKELQAKIEELRERAEKLGVRLEDLICQVCD